MIEEPQNQENDPNVEDVLRCLHEGRLDSGRLLALMLINGIEEKLKDPELSDAEEELLREKEELEGVLGEILKAIEESEQ